MIWIQCWPGFGHHIRHSISQGPFSLKDSVALGRAMPVHGRWCSMCCMRRNDLCSLHGCWQGEPRKLPEWTKKPHLSYHRCFLSAQISLLLRLVITTVPLHFAIPGRFQRCRAGSNSTVELLSVVRVPVVFLMIYLWHAVVHATWSSCGPSNHPSLALSNLSERAVWRKMASISQLLFQCSEDFFF